MIIWVTGQGCPLFYTRFPLMPDIFRQLHADESITLLLVEDNPGDGRLTRGVRDDGRETTLHIVIAGEDDLALSRRRGGYDQISHCRLELGDTLLQ